MSDKQSSDVVQIEIFDQIYPLRLTTAAEKENVLKIAADLDARMREIARQTGTVDSLKVAILTALHIAEETREQNDDARKLEAAVRLGARKWIAAIDTELDKK